jgi:hypothetical protein
MEMQSATNNLASNIDLIFHQTILVSQIAQKDILTVDIQQLRQHCTELSHHISSAKKYTQLSNQLKRVERMIKTLETLVEAPHDALANALARQLEQSLIGNFQVSALSKLRNKAVAATDEVSVNFGQSAVQKMGHLTLKSEQLEFEIDEEAIDAFQQIDNVVYLESPVYWKIKDVLKGWVDMRNDPMLRRRLKHQQKALKKVPDYILDTFALLDTEIVQGESNEALAQIQQAIQQCIGGHIQVPDSGDLQFYNQSEQGEDYVVDLHQAATGATALGIIALLLEKGAIVPNSVLIFDEPEVNLHPAWQHVMIQVLYQLSLAGVRIVMATHSFDMIENIEKMMDSHEEKGLEVNDHFCIVQLDDGLSIHHDKPIFKKLDAVKADLGMPLFDLFSAS